MFSPAVVVPPHEERTVIMLLWVRLPADAMWTAQAAGTLHDLYANGLRPAAARWAFVAEATAPARSCRDVTEPDVADGATAAGA